MRQPGNLLGEFDLRHLRKQVAVRKRDEDRVVRHAFGEQIVPGESRAQADKAQVDLVAFERLELLGGEAPFPRASRSL
jgi:hypothetical protein